MQPLILVIFALTYVAISARRLQILPIGRPAAALVGASVCVLCAEFASDIDFKTQKALHAIEPNTISLLFGMMVVAAGLDVAGFFAFSADALSRRIRSPVALLVSVTVASGLLSSVLVNDAVCLLATPLVVGMVRRAGLPIRPFLFAICMGSNAGSALTLSGNPQNMLVAQLSGLSYRQYLFSAAAPTAWALFVTSAVLVFRFRSEVVRGSETEANDAASTFDRGLVVIGILSVAGLIAANLAGMPLALTAMLAASVVLLASKDRAEILLSRVDFSVLVFFAALFVLVGALGATGYPSRWLELIPVSAKDSPIPLVAVLSAGSQIVSNVPLIMLLEPWIRSLPDPALSWTLTAVVSTLAGNLTLLGSVANIIVIERAAATLRPLGQEASARIGFVEYLLVGLPVTLLSTLGAVAILLAMTP